MSIQSESVRPILPALQAVAERFSGLSYPLIRATIGLLLIPHGAQKLFGWFGGGGLSVTAQAFEQNLGLEPGLFFAVLAGATEFFGGLALVLGFLTRPAALAVFCVMVYAVFGVHLANGFFWGNGGYEYPLMWGLVALAVFLKGGGRLSIDRAIGREF